MLKDSQKADMDLFPYRLFALALPPLVVSKCALAGKEKASLVQREVARQRRDGGIAKVKIDSKNNPSAAFGVSSLYTREPLAVIAYLTVIPLIKLSLKTRTKPQRSFCFMSLFFRRNASRSA